MSEKRVLLLLIAFVVMISSSSAVAAKSWPGNSVMSGSKIQYRRPSADDFIDSLDENMRDELVRSVLSEEDEKKLARMLWGEDRENKTTMRAAIIWCVFNRMEAGRLSVNDLINETSFPGYKDTHPVKEWAVNLVRDVTIRYVLEKNGFTDVGRVLPREFLYYEQKIDQRYHMFKTKLKIHDPETILWDWSLPSPYKD